MNKEIFMYELVVVAIVRDEAKYIKEWLDYHLLAGVEHFLIYNNESQDNLQEVLKPYEEKKLVTVIPYPKTYRQLEAYNDAVRYFNFFCRWMAFIDVDEFIYPQDDKSITQVLEEVGSSEGIAIKLRTFGANNLEKADFETGVLERFTRRAKETGSVKTIANPRRIKFFNNPHEPEYYETSSVEVSEEKIVINYYATKSREEYAEKAHKRVSARFAKRNEVEGFEENNFNEIFDDGILRYREKLSLEQITAGTDFLKKMSVKNRVNNARMLQALVGSLTPNFNKNNVKLYLEKPKNRAEYFNDLIKLYKNAPPTFFEGKLETYLICLTVSDYLKSYVGEQLGAMFEEASLNALCKTFLTKVTIVEFRLLLKELPRLLALPYAAVNSLVEGCYNTLIQFLQDFRVSGEMEKFEEFTYLLRMLRTIAAYRTLIGK